MFILRVFGPLAAEAPMSIDQALPLIDQTLPRYLFFTGKGAVGKTSAACAMAVTLALRGKSVLVVSTDAASSLDEVLGTPLGTSRTPRSVEGVPHLFAMNLVPPASKQQALGQEVGQ